MLGLGLGIGPTFGGTVKIGYVFAAHGDSLLGASTAAPTPATQLQSMIAASALTGSPTLTAYSHGGYTIAPTGAGEPGNLAALAASEIDVLVQRPKNNILWFIECTNSLYYYLLGGATSAAAQASTEADLTAYVNARKVAGWDRILCCSVMPRQNTGTPAAFEATRVAFNVWLRANAASLGIIVVDIGADARIGVLAANTNAFWFLADLVHTTANANAVMASLVMEQIRGLFPAAIPYIPAHMPYLALAHDASTGCLNGSSAPCANGDGCATWTNTATYSGGSATQATSGKQPPFSAAGFGGKPALSISSGHWMQGAATPIGGTLVFVAKATAHGAGVDLASAPHLIYFDLAEVGNGSWTVVYDGTGGLSEWTAANGAMGIGAAHVYAFAGDGTNAGSVLYVDGSPVVLTTFGGLTGSPALTLNATAVPYIGGNDGLAGFTGLLGAVYSTPVPLTSHEVGLLNTYIHTQRNFP